jgi:phage replication O-like protein O
MEMDRPKRAGFRKIDNRLFQAMMSAQLTGSGYQVLLKVIDETIGFHRKEAKISLTRFQQATGLSRQSVRLAIKETEERLIIQAQRDSTRPTVYSVGDQREWLARKRNHPTKLGNQITPDWETKSPQARKLAMPGTTGIKEILKENSKDNGTYKERVLDNNISSYGQALPSPTALSSDRVRLISRERSTADRNLIGANPKKTYQEQIITYLDTNGPSAIRAISRGTGINPNPLNVTLHNGKGKVFYHDSKKRVWGLIAFTNE